jgi:hypothetical protein
MIIIFGVVRSERIPYVSVMIGRFTVKLYSNSSACDLLNPDIGSAKTDLKPPSSSSFCTRFIYSDDGCLL